ncbi:hypothetical protein SNEBB_008231 [Seison nebaliae]|nr:hypothetical protein SNEBB_008231 [Seison nebaliae]
MEEWCLIESDPGLFTHLIGELGCNKLEVDELYSMDEATLNSIKSSYGLIFLFKWSNLQKDKGGQPMTGGKYLKDGELLEKLFFAEQVIQNACATQAILSILLNIRDDKIEIGKTLTEFKEFTGEFSSRMKGEALTNSDHIRLVHNKYARIHQLSQPVKGLTGKKEDVFHFVAYIPFEKHIIELDGTRSHPIDHGTYSGDNWLTSASGIISKRMDMYQSYGSEIRFNLMYLKYSTALEIVERVGELAQETTEEADEEMMKLQFALQQEEEKKNRRDQDNIRRCHNYVPTVVVLINWMAKCGILKERLGKAKEIRNRRAKLLSAQKF